MTFRRKCSKIRAGRNVPFEPDVAQLAADTLDPHEAREVMPGDCFVALLVIGMLVVDGDCSYIDSKSRMAPPFSSSPRARPRVLKGCLGPVVVASGL